MVKSLPFDKAPGPDGFNTDFIKKCWPIVKQYFYNLCEAFYNGDVCLQSINGSHITLVPKSDMLLNSQTLDPSPFSILQSRFLQSY